MAAFASAAVLYAYRFARLMVNHPLALLVAVWTGLTPVVFSLSQQVMLEVPTFVFVLAAVVHFEKYLNAQRARDALLTCALAACAVLTRFDGVLVVLYFGIRLVRTWNLKLLVRRPVLLGIGLAALLAVPYYAFTLTVYGSGLSTTAGTGTGAADGGFTAANLVYYLASLPEQAGWVLTIAAVVGFLLTLACHRRESGPAFALLLAVYLLFTPLSQLNPRHALYWLPAIAVCAARPVQWLWEREWKTIAGLLTAGLTVCVGVELPQRVAFRYVFGYEDTANWVTDHRTTDRPVLVDGELAGSMVYHTRLHDPARRVWVLRADKVLYNQFSDPSTGYRQYANTEAEVLAQLEKWDPEFVVVEDPPPSFRPVPGSELLVRTLRANSGGGKPFEAVERIPIRSNYDRFSEPGAALTVYRKRHRNPDATADIQIELVGLGRTIGTTRP